MLNFEVVNGKIVEVPNAPARDLRPLGGFAPAMHYSPAQAAAMAKVRYPASAIRDPLHPRPEDMTAAKAVALPLFRVAEVFDAPALAKIDPLLHEGAVFVLFAPNASITIADVATLEPVDAGQAVTCALSLAAYEAMVASAGVDDDAELSAAYDAEGEEAARAALVGVPSGAMSEFRGEGVARRRMSAAVARRYLVGPRAGRVLFTPGDKARELDAAKATREAAEAQARAEVERVQAEAARPRTLAELAIDVVAVSKARIGVTPDPLTRELPGPFVGAMVLWDDEHTRYYGWRIALGVELPAFASDDLAKLAPETTAPATVRPAPDATPAAVAFVRSLRDRFAHDDLGPIALDRFSDAGLEKARELAAQHGHYVASPRRGEQWRARWVAELIVRGCLVRPDVAAGLLADAAAGGARNPNAPTVSVPTMGQAGRREIPNPAYQGPVDYRDVASELCASAATSGASVGAGVLVAPAPTTKTKARR